MTKTAVVLFNLGGPDSLKAVKPFLFNLFSDPAIITLPQPFRTMLAFLISTLRNKKAQDIYRHLGGKSPIFERTVVQAEALEQKLNEENSADEYKVFISMRHWNPMSDVVVRKVKSYDPDRVVLLPLYPQYSTTTTGSSFGDWHAKAKKYELDAPTDSVCCYPTDRSFIASHVKLIKDVYWKASEQGIPRILFSAHGLPEKTIASGDPYQWQVEKTVASVVQVLAIDNLDYRICYQSRVGRLVWIGPSIAEEILSAGEDNVPVLVVPISFVSEHSETLVELDIEYRHLAKTQRVPGYWRVPALAAEEFFIEALAGLCRIKGEDGQVRSCNKERLCPRNFEKCPCTV